MIVKIDNLNNFSYIYKLDLKLVKSKEFVRSRNVHLYMAHSITNTSPKVDPIINSKLKPK